MVSRLCLAEKYNLSIINPKQIQILESLYPESNQILKNGFQDSGRDIKIKESYGVDQASLLEKSNQNLN